MITPNSLSFSVVTMKRKLILFLVSLSINGTSARIHANLVFYRSPHDDECIHGFGFHEHLNNFFANNILQVSPNENDIFAKILCDLAPGF